MYTDQRRQVNYFVPDACTLFHVLGICDNLMNTTHRFTQSTPGWLPIVSQLYISVLWLYQILTVYCSSGYGMQFASILRDLNEILRIDECVIPGPLVPFFQALASVNGPFDWIGDIVSALPDFAALWNAAHWRTTDSFVRSVPIPAVLVDQLHYFAVWTVPANQTLYGNFEWYRNVFSTAVGTGTTRYHRMAPTTTGSLYTTDAQSNSARSFWNPFFSTQTRNDNSAGNPTFNQIAQLFGFVNQHGQVTLDWFQHVTIIMHKYAQYFNGSTSIKSISPTGVGAVLVHARPQANQGTRNWLYPAAIPGPFLSSRFNPLREIPSAVKLDFQHSDHEIEEIAEQYAILTSTNVQWARNNATQHGMTAINVDHTHEGSYWTAPSHRRADGINLKVQFAQLISHRYHQTTANKSA